LKHQPLDRTLVQLVRIQYHKGADVVSKTTDIMAKHGFPVNDLKELLSELYGSELITREEVEGNIHLLEHQPLDGILVRIQYHKGADVVSKTADIMAKHGFPVNDLKVLSELYGSHHLKGEFFQNKDRHGLLLHVIHHFMILSGLHMDLQCHQGTDLQYHQGTDLQ
jgi:hypothetical protein